MSGRRRSRSWPGRRGSSRRCGRRWPATPAFASRSCAAARAGIGRRARSSRRPARTCWRRSCRPSSRWTRTTPPAALGHAERYLRGLGDDQPIESAAALELLVPVRIRLGEPALARDAHARLAATAGAVGSDPLRAAERAAAGRIALAERDLDEARRAFEDALDLHLRCAAPFEAALARLDLARTLGGQDRPAAGVEHALAARAALEGLGAERAARQADKVVVRLGGPELRGAARRVDAARGRGPVAGRRGAVEPTDRRSGCSSASTRCTATWPTSTRGWASRPARRRSRWRPSATCWADRAPLTSAGAARSWPAARWPDRVMTGRPRSRTLAERDRSGRERDPEKETRDGIHHGTPGDRARELRAPGRDARVPQRPRRDPPDRRRRGRAVRVRARLALVERRQADRRDRQLRGRRTSSTT